MRNRWLGLTFLPVASLAGVVVLLALVSVDVQANHPYGDPQRIARNTWYDWYAGADRDHSITFRVCDNLGDPNIVVWALWQGWTLNSNHRYDVQYISSCGTGTNLLVWGRTQSQIDSLCGTPSGGGHYWGCWDSYCEPGGQAQQCKWDPSHYGGAWVNDIGIIYVNRDVWNSWGTNNYPKRYLVNHEHGHGNGLDDHTLYSCDAYTVMSRGVQSQSCYPQYPTSNDFNTVNCNYYYQC